MSESVTLPALGESVTEGTVTRWLKSVGDRVEVDEPLLEVSTDKVDTEIPSPVAGIIEEILVAEDETVEVGTALVRIGDGAPSPVDAGAGGQATPADVPGADPAAAGIGETASAPPDSAPTSDPSPAAEASTPDPSGELEAEVPSSEAPQADESGSAPAPAPAQTVDPVPAAPVVVAAVPTPAFASPAPVASSAPEPSVVTLVPPVPPVAPAPTATPEEPDAPAAVEPALAPAAAGVSGVAAEPEAGAGAQSAYVTPLVRKLAHELGVDLATVAGTGVGGRIRKEDVTAAQSAVDAPSTDAVAVVAVETSPLRGTTVPMSRLRKVIAERAVASMQSSAQLTSVVEIDVTKVAVFRESVKAEFATKTGVKLSFLPFFALTAAEALKSFPIVNATIEGESIVYPAHENLSIAVDTERGLLTPVIRDASELSLAQIAQQIADLAARTRDNNLKPDELAGGTFTLTNTGSRGALFDTPVVFMPQSAILGTGIVVKRPVVVSGDGSDAIAIRSMVYFALSYDHRIVDGADAARFLGAVKARLESGDFSGNLGL